VASPVSSRQLRTAVPDGFNVLFDGTGNEVGDQVLGVVRRGGRGIFIVGGAPPARDGIEFESFGATTTTERLDAIGKLAASGKLRMPIEASISLSVRARR
jgi:NADPH:quinone reductase-like Zn-dependent oxidoreductase